MTRLSIRLLGPMQVTLDSQSVTRFETAKARALLAYLAITPDKPHRRDFLAEFLWPERPAGMASANLRHTLATLRRAIGDTGAIPSPTSRASAPRLLITRQTIQLNSCADIWVDALAFTALLRATQPPAPPRLAALEEAVALVRGPFLEDVSVLDSPSLEDWLLVTREHFRRLVLEALHQLAGGYEQTGAYQQALPHARRQVELEPGDERAQRQLMRLLAFAGQRNAALSQYEACCRVLTEELGVEPELETMELGRRIRDGGLLPPSAAHEGQPVAWLPGFLDPAAQDAQPSRFVARERELATLQTSLDQALEGHGGVAFVTGGPGQGKTALLGEFSRRAMDAHPELLVARGNCSAISGIGDPYLPFRDALAMLTGDVEARWLAGAISRDHARRLWEALPLVIPLLLNSGPSLIGPILSGEALLARVAQALPHQAGWLGRLAALSARARAGPVDLQQSFLFEQVSDVLHTLAGKRPLTLLLDDMQWVDAASTALLFHLCRRLAESGNRMLVICAYRPEEVALGRGGEPHPLDRVLQELKRMFGDVWLDLDMANEREGRVLVNALLDTERNRLGAGFREALFHRTAGHPLFTVELLQALQERGNLIPDVRSDGAWIEGPALNWEELPARVEAVIAQRVDRLNPELRELINIAGVEGELFTAQVVAAVQGVAERPMLRALQRLENVHRLVREAGEVQAGTLRVARYHFSHILVQEYVHRQLSAGERRLLHGQVARALQSLYQGHEAEIAVQLAHHFYEADDWDQAFRYSLMVAENAARAYASAEAIAHYTRAMELAGRLSLDAAALASLHRGRGLAYATLGDFAYARADYEAALQQGRAAGERLVEWRALLDLAELWTSRDYGRSRRLIDAALQLAHSLDDATALADSLNWAGNWYANAEDPARAMAYHRQALAIFAQVGDDRELANTLDLLGITSLLGGDPATSIGYYDRSIALCRELKDYARLADGLTGRGIAYSAAYIAPAVVCPSAPAIARRDLDEAMAIAVEIDSPSAEAWAAWALSLWHTGMGQFGQAWEAVHHALHVASAVGHREWMAGARCILGALCVELLAPEAAQANLEQGLALAQELHSQHWIHHATAALVATWVLLGRPAEALSCLEAVVTPETGMDTIHKRTSWLRRSQLALVQGDPALALDIADRLIASAPGMAPGRVVTALWQLRAEALAGLGHSDEACALLQAAVANARAAEEHFHLWRLHASLGRLTWSMGRRPEAEQELAQARALIAELGQTVPDPSFRDNFIQAACGLLQPAP